MKANFEKKGKPRKYRDSETLNNSHKQHKKNIRKLRLNKENNKDIYND